MRAGDDRAPSFRNVTQIREATRELTRGLGATAIGVVVGILAATSLTHVLTSLLFGVAPNDPATLAGVCAVILVAAAAACVVPAWRASL